MSARAEKRSADRACRAERRQSRAKIARFEDTLPGLQEQEQSACLMSDIIVNDEEHVEGAEYDKDAEGEKQGDFTIWRKHHDRIDNWKCKQQNWQNKISLRYVTCWKNFDNWI